MTARPKVLILGGGFAGLETAFTLRHRHAVDADITLVSDRDYFLYQPGLVDIPFGGSERRLSVPVRKPLFRRNITFLEGRVAEVDPALHRVELFDGTYLPFDFLVIATGATTNPDELPGLAEHAATIDTPARLRELGSEIRTLVTAAEHGRRQRVLFLVPPGCAEPGPLYQTALRLEALLTKRRVRDQVELHWATYEQQHLSGFGFGIQEQVCRQFGARGIASTMNVRASKVIDRCVEFEDATSQEYDLLVSCAPSAPAVAYPALPKDLRGFVRTEPVTRQVIYHTGIYAPGAAGNRPAGQALAALVQAGIVADIIASRIRPGGMVAVSRLLLDSVRMSPLWTLGRHALGGYLSIRFRAGRPFWPGTNHHDRTSR